jgi:hypothetical protein
MVRRSAKFINALMERQKDLGYVCFSGSGFRKTTFKIFLCLFAIRKLINGKHFPVK